MNTQSNTVNTPAAERIDLGTVSAETHGGAIHHVFDNPQSALKDTQMLSAD